MNKLFHVCYNNKNAIFNTRSSIKKSIYMLDLYILYVYMT